MRNAFWKTAKKPSACVKTTTSSYFLLGKAFLKSNEKKKKETLLGMPGSANSNKRYKGHLKLLGGKKIKPTSVRCDLTEGRELSKEVSAPEQKRKCSGSR